MIKTIKYININDEKWIKTLITTLLTVYWKWPWILISKSIALAVVNEKLTNKIVWKISVSLLVNKLSEFHPRYERKSAPKFLFTSVYCLLQSPVEIFYFVYLRIQRLLIFWPQNYAPSQNLEPNPIWIWLWWSQGFPPYW